MIRHEDDGYWISFRELIAVHHDEVFACLTQPEGLTRWFPVAAEIDLRTGGTIVFFWDADRTKKTTIAILDYNAGGRIVWDWYADHNDLHAPVYWTVRPDMERGARVEFLQGPFNEKIDSLVAMAQEAESWRWQLCNLRSVLEVKHDMRAVRPL